MGHWPFVTPCGVGCPHKIPPEFDHSRLIRVRVRSHNGEARLPSVIVGWPLFPSLAMPESPFDVVDFKRALKEALAETLHEQRELLHEVFAEVLEDFALVEAIREGLETKTATREEVFRILRGKS